MSVIVGAVTVRTSRRGLAIAEADHDARRREREARAELRLNVEPINMAFDPLAGAYVSEGTSARVRLRIEIQNSGDRAAGPGRMEIDVPTAINDYGMRWVDLGGAELPDHPERAARFGEHNVLARRLGLIGKDTGEVVFVTLPTPVPEPADGVA